MVQLWPHPLHFIATRSRRMVAATILYCPRSGPPSNGACTKSIEPVRRSMTMNRQRKSSTAPLREPQNTLRIMLRPTAPRPTGFWVDSGSLKCGGASGKEPNSRTRIKVSRRSWGGRQNLFHHRGGARSRQDPPRSSAVGSQGAHDAVWESRRVERDCCFDWDQRRGDPKEL